MKIEGPGRTSGPRGVSKADAKKKSGESGFSSMIEETDSPSAQSAVSAPMAIGQLDALLSLQEAGGGTSEEAARKSKKRAAALLDQLDKIKIGILTGGVPQSALQQLTHLIKMHRENVVDPALSEILDEIDLRAQVELAKHGR